MPYRKGRCGPSKTRGGSSSTSDPPPESEQGDMASPLSPISDDSGFCKASTSSSAEILLERLVSALVMMKSALLDSIFTVGVVFAGKLVSSVIPALYRTKLHWNDYILFIVGVVLLVDRFLL